MNKQTLLIIIYCLFLNITWGQSFYLKTKSKDSITHSNLNSLTSFKNLKEQNTYIHQLKEQLLHKGYFNTEISSIKKVNDSTQLITITPNKQYQEININHNNDISQKTLKKILSNNTKTSPTYFTSKTNELDLNLNSIVKHYTDSGKTFSKLQLQNIFIRNDSVFADLKTTTSKTNTINNIIIKGYEKFPRKFLKHYLNLKSNKKLNTTEVEKKSLQLNNLRFASEQQKPGILFTKDSTEVYLYINKKKSNSFDGFLGFSSNTETNKLEFNGNINLQLINNLNTGEELHLKYQSTENEQRKLNLKTNLPFIFNSPISIEGELDIFKKDSTFTNTQQDLKAFYQISSNIKIGIGTKFINSNALKNPSPTNIDYKKTAFTLNFQHSKPSLNKLFIHKTLTNLELSTGTRKGEANTNQQSILLSSEYNFNLNTKNSIYLKNQSYYLISNQILENESHYIGGINSIRGFQENSIPSNLYNTLNLEYRITLNNSIYIHSVTDYSYTKNQIDNSTNNLFGFGIGFGLQTNNNLLRFIFANSKTNNELVKFTNSKIHLSLKVLF